MSFEPAFLGPSRGVPAPAARTRSVWRTGIRAVETLGGSLKQSPLHKKPNARSWNRSRMLGRKPNHIMDPSASDAHSKRKYQRRSEDERIAELEAQLQSLKARKTTRERMNDPMAQEIPKVVRRLRKFAQFAMDQGRGNVANSVTAFTAGLERTLNDILNEPPPSPRKTPPIVDLL